MAKKAAAGKKAVEAKKNSKETDPTEAHAKAEAKKTTKAEARKTSTAVAKNPPASPPVGTQVTEALRQRSLSLASMAPSSARSSGSERAEASPAEDDKDEVDIGWKRRLQSNLSGQVKNAKDKLAKGALGIVHLSDDQRSDLLQKVKFGEDYAEVTDQGKKDDMLMAFKADKSCKTWATYKHEYQKSEFTTEKRVNGYGTKLLGNIV